MARALTGKTARKPMDEKQWQSCRVPDAMLSFLLTSGKGCERKFRLFAVACYRRIWHLLTDERARNVVEVAEKYADKRVGSRKLRAAASKAELDRSLRVYAAARNGEEAARGSSHAAAYVVVAAAPVLEGGVFVNELRDQTNLLRDLFGQSPFRSLPAVDAGWLRWSDATVPKIAQGVYDERRFEDLPILADALEDAGCANEDLLAHCRSAGEHVRGCWAVDLLLGRA